MSRWSAAVTTIALSATPLPAQDPAPVRLVEVARCQAPGGEISSASFDRAGTRVLTCGTHDLMLWSVPDGGEVLRIDLGTWRAGDAWLHPTRPFALVSVWRNTEQGLLAVDLTAGTTRRIDGHGRAGCAWSPDGRQVALSRLEDKRNVIELFDQQELESGRAQPRRSWSPGRPWARHLVFSPDGTRLLASNISHGRVASAEHHEIALDEDVVRYGFGAPLGFRPDGKPIVAPDQNTLHYGEVAYRRHERPQWAVSPKGEHVLAIEGVLPESVQRLTPGPPVDVEFSGWIKVLVAGPAGTLLIGDADGQLTLVSESGNRHLVGHRTAVHGLAWSPDSAYLAVTGAGGATVVDRNARANATFAGHHHIAAGPAGPEFWVADASGITRWHAGSARAVGAHLAYPIGWRPDLGPRSDATAPRFDSIDQDHLFVFAKGAMPSRWSPVIVDTRGRTVAPARAAEPIHPFSSYTEIRSIARDSATGTVVVAEDTISMSCGLPLMGLEWFGNLRSLDRDGTLVQELWTRDEPLAMAVGAGSCYVVDSGNAVRRLRLPGLVELERATAPGEISGFWVLDGDRALARMGKRLAVWSLQPLAMLRTLEVELEEAAAFSYRGAIALSPDRARLAIAGEVGVTIYRIER